MQKLLTGKVRFKEFEGHEWKSVRLKEALKMVPRPVDKPDKPYTALSLRSHGKGAFLRDVKEPAEVMMGTLYQVKENDLIVNITFAWEGAITILRQEHEQGLVSHRFPTYEFNTDIALPEYFRQLVLTKYFVHNLILISPGGAGRNRVLNKKDFMKLKIDLPTVEEQQKIASVLTAQDIQIDLLKKQKANLEQQKKGLMQKLLTGEIRVKTD